jgi:hypothetical protein
MGLGRRRAAALLGLCGLLGCDQGSEPCDPGELIFGSLSASCPSEARQCQSWEPFLAPGRGLHPDWSASPPRADVMVGATFGVGVHTRFNSPANCTTGQLSYSVEWRATDPSVLRAETEGHLGARFLAVAPGTARVVAENLAFPGGQTGHAEVTVCSEPGANDFACPRVPLDIRVLLLPAAAGL